MKPALIPQPVQLALLDGFFELTSITEIEASYDLRESATYLAERLRRGTGFGLPVIGPPVGVAIPRIILSLSGDEPLGNHYFR